MSGTPFHRLEFFRPLLESVGDFSLTDESHLKTYIPLIETQEVETLKRELKGEFIGISFDGTSRLGEALNITGRFCDSSFQLHSRLLRFVTAKVHLKAPQLASLITTALCAELSVPPTHVVCISRDSASVNGAACTLLTGSTFAYSENVLCISHTLNNVGSRIHFDVLSSFMTPWLELVGGRNPHRGAQSLWRQTVAPRSVPGYSQVRWHSLAEIQFVLAEEFDKLASFLTNLDTLGYGEATRAKLHTILDDPHTCRTLKLQLAAMRDIRALVQMTYELEGDRLEILLVHQRIEKLRALGRAMQSGADVIPNVDAILRHEMKLVNGVKMSKFFEGHGMCEGKIISKRQGVASDLYPGQTCAVYQVKYSTDGQVQEFEEVEIRQLLVVKHLPERQEILDSLQNAFEYLEERITGACANQQFSCAHMYSVCEVVQALNPLFAAQHLTDDFATRLFHTVASLSEHISLPQLKAQIPAYLAMAAAFECDMDDVSSFTTSVLHFWKCASQNTLSEWKKAARIVFCMSPNSASCERVFSLLDAMYGDSQMLCLADHLQASLMLRYNGRKIM